MMRSFLFAAGWLALVLACEGEERGSGADDASGAGADDGALVGTDEAAPVGGDPPGAPSVGDTPPPAVVNPGPPTALPTQAEPLAPAMVPDAPDPAVMPEPSQVDDAAPAPAERPDMSAGGAGGGAGAAGGGAGGDSTAGAGAMPADNGAGGDSQQPVAPEVEPIDPTGTPAFEEREVLPSVRQEHSAIGFDGEVYVIGGFTPSVTASVQVYNPELDNWRDVADFPETLHHASVATVGDELYVLGFNRGGGFSDIDGRVFAYNATADEWTPRTPMPDGTERSSSCIAALGTKIYLIAGSLNTNGNTTAVVHSSVYDTVLDEWEILPDAPSPREHCIAGAVGGKVYVVSGRDGRISGVDPETWEFDPATNEFSQRAPIPTPRGGTAGAVLGNKIYIFGGEGNDADPNGIFHAVEAYVPSTDTWETLPNMLIGRHGFAAAVVGDRIYLPGGADSQGFGAAEYHTVFFFE